MIEFSRPKRPSLTLDMAPLIDVVFLLLVFFILTSSFLPPALPLELPRTSNEQVAPAEPVVVSMDAQGSIAINGVFVSNEGFHEALKVALLGSESKAVHFRGDRLSEYGKFLQLMDSARSAGAEKLHLVHEPK